MSLQFHYEMSLKWLAKQPMEAIPSRSALVHSTCSFPALRSLDLKRSRRLQDSDLEELATTTSLRWLSLDGCEGVTDAALLEVGPAPAFVGFKCLLRLPACQTPSLLDELGTASRFVLLCKSALSPQLPCQPLLALQ